MGNSGWTADKLNLTLPPGATAPETFIYVGDADGDPYGMLTYVGLDSGVVFYFGTAPYAYVFGIFQDFLAGVPTNDGHLYLVGVDQIAGDILTILETDWIPQSAGGPLGMPIQIGEGLNFMFYESDETEMHAASGDVLISAGGTVTIGEHTTFPGSSWPTDIDGELYVRQNELGWGIWNSVGAAASSAAIGAETVVLTLPATTYIAGRAYRATVHAGVSGNTAGALADMRLRKTNAAGAILAELYRTELNTNGPVHAQHATCEFVVGANDVTATLVLTISASAGTVTQFGNATSARTITIEDIGSAAQVTSTVTVLT